MSTVQIVPLRTVTEWSFVSQQEYENPFVDMALDVVFHGPGGQEVTLPAFYDGDRIWKVRFNPGTAGEWSYRGAPTPPDADLSREGRFSVAPGRARGFLQAAPGAAWGFRYESGEPVFLLGDTVYNLFGMAHCGGNVTAFLERRAAQGFNLLRVRVPVSPFHPPEAYSAWQARRTWPWGGSEQSPQFDRFNLDYFRSVDQVVGQVERLGLGLEMIMEAWGFEFPFNSRQIFVAEWEALWLRYLVARYDAYNCLYFWTPMNEYEYYPNGDWHYKPVADRWAMRVARYIKNLGQHGHIVSVHNGPGEPPFARRFAADPDAVDAILYQTWGTTGEKDGWLAAGIEERVGASLKDWWGSALLAEWGYERNPEFELLIPGHQYCDADHTRRGAWRGMFCGLGIIHGFENSWGPWMLLEEDQPGLESLLHLRHFLAEEAPFARLFPAPGLVQAGAYLPGYEPRALATKERDWIAVYFPAGGQALLDLPGEACYQAGWFDPCNGQVHAAEGLVTGAITTITAPGGLDEKGHPLDAVLVLKLCEEGGTR